MDVRIALLGRNGVGKTAIAMRFAHGIFIIGGLEAMEITNSKIMLVNGCCVTVEVTEISDPMLFTHTMDGCLLTNNKDPMGKAHCYCSLSNTIPAKKCYSYIHLGFCQ